MSLDLCHQIKPLMCRLCSWLFLAVKPHLKMNSALLWFAYSQGVIDTHILNWSIHLKQILDGQYESEIGIFGLCIGGK